MVYFFCFLFSFFIPRKLVFLPSKRKKNKQNEKKKKKCKRVLKTSGRLASYQDTYLGFEIWEIDQIGNKYRLINSEWQWNGTQCTFKINVTTNEIIPCPVLPLTDTTQYSYDLFFFCFFVFLFLFFFFLFFLENNEKSQLL